MKNVKPLTTNSKYPTKRKKVAVLTNGFLAWGGGIDFLRNILEGLALLSDEFEIFVLIRADQSFEVNKWGRIFLRFLPGWVIRWLKPKKIQPFLEFTDKLNIIFHPGLRVAFRLIKPDVIFPSTFTNHKIPWCGYLYDCQHKHYEEFFSLGERQSRDYYFQEMSNAPAIIVNSQDTKEDLVSFFKMNSDKIFNLPFAPILRSLDWLKDNSKLLNNYNLPERYFLVSNQFWIHKSHSTAFKALAVLNKKYPDVYLVCTGQMEDGRFPEYIQDLKKLISEHELESKIILLGYIPKRHQIEIMKNSIAVLQPTLFEGGPGGGVTYDATSLGLRVILSDIKVNKEIEHLKNLTYFKTGDHHSLVTAMEKVLEEPFSTMSKDDLLIQSNAYVRTLAGRIREVLLYALRF